MKLGAVVLLLSWGCVAGEDETAIETDELTCATSSSTYTPYSGSSPTGTVAEFPWRGATSSYPSGNEDVRAYTLPTTIECSSGKSRRSHLDVTAGCLTAVAIGDYSRARISSTTSGAFRAVALGYTDGMDEPLKWTDQSVEYRFYYLGKSGSGSTPGFKAFVRYRTEDDLYVASWRLDGYIDIKKKQCGSYRTLAQIKRTAPRTGEWHRIRFDAIGDSLALYLDGERVLTARDSTFSWGTAGIRTDAMTGAYLDDWRVFDPTP